MRLIDADEAIEFVKNILYVHRYYHPRSTTENVPISEVIDKIEQVPTVDAVRVVRCKECKYWRNPPDCEGDNNYGCCWDGIGYTLANWYCADGERREVTE